jgi:superfamily I DNA/RNA helicase
MSQHPMRLVKHKSFERQLRKIQRGGGLGEYAFAEAQAAIQNWKRGWASALRLTHNGESRIPHAKKYDLPGFFRLVTTEHEGVRTLLWIGKHDEVEQWLDRRKGWDHVVTDDGEIEFIPTGDSTNGVESLLKDDLECVRTTGKVLASIPDRIVGLLNLSAPTLRTLRLITYEDLADDATGSWSIIADQTYASPEQQGVVFDIFDLLRNGEAAKAIARAKLFANHAVQVSDDPALLVAALDSGSATAEVLDIGTLTDAEYAHIASRATYADWLLYLHPHQKRHVDAEHNGTARLIGVSGSGKTCVLVHRANILAKRYPGERILILVLNKSLEHLINNLLDELCVPDVREHIHVRRVYDYCYDAIKEIAPQSLIERYDPMSREDLDDCWHDFTEKEHALRLVEPLIPPLESAGVDPWAYLYDELIWIRTGFGHTAAERDAYLDCVRHGRGLPFPTTARGRTLTERPRPGSSFPADTRLRVLAILDQYEEYMSEGGLLDEDGVALRAFSIRPRIAKTKRLKARCVLVDEVQDCSTNQLAVISSLPTKEHDGLFLVGDPVQKVFPRQQNLGAAGIDIRGRSFHLNTNYRNSRQVLEAAYQIIAAFRGKSPVSDDEILNPEYAYRSGPRPKVVRCKSRPEQYRCIGAMIELMRHDAENTICVATAHPTIIKPPPPPFGAPRPPVVSVDRYLLELCKENRWPVKSLAEPVRLVDLTGNVIAARFEDMKGFEFRSVFLTDLSDKALLAKSIPKEEEWRVAFQLYVAMTRAQQELWLFSVGKPSRLLDPLKNFVDFIAPEEI